MKLKTYFGRLLIAIDQFFNTVFGGYPDETISSRWGRTRKDSKVADLGCDVLDKIQKDHCEISEEYTEDGTPKPHHLPPLEGSQEVRQGAVNAPIAGSNPAPPANMEVP